MLLNAWFSKVQATGEAEILGGATTEENPAEPRETASLAARLAPEETASPLLAENGDLSTPSLKGTISAAPSQVPSKPTLASAKPAKIVNDSAPATPEAVSAPSRYFIQPTSGRNWGILHSQGGVDIANSCGTPIVAAASGVVTRRMTGWNSGYGNYLMIEHPNGTETRYAHMQEMWAKVGDAVNQGAQIGTIGNTGKVEGGNGCHLHFEVHGAPNPFVKR